MFKISRSPLKEKQQQLAGGGKWHNLIYRTVLITTTTPV